MRIDGYGADSRTREEEIERTLQAVQAVAAALSENFDCPCRRIERPRGRHQNAD